MSANARLAKTEVVLGLNCTPYHEAVFIRRKRQNKMNTRRRDSVAAKARDVSFFCFDFDEKRKYKREKKRLKCHFGV